MGERIGTLLRGGIYLALLTSSIIGTVVSAIKGSDLVAGILGGLATGIFLIVLDTAIVNTRYLKFAWWSLRYRKAEVRISASYLFRIHQSGLYLLVRGSRYPTQFQPVGGVYKSTPPFLEKLNKWGGRRDDLLPNDLTSEQDLRIVIMGSNLLSFWRWFVGQSERETSPWREFYEELVSPGLLPAALFPYIFYTFNRRRVEFRFSAQAQKQELLVADIFTLDASSEQSAQLSSLAQSTNNDAKWFSAESIRRLGAMTQQPPQNDTIAITASWTL